MSGKYLSSGMLSNKGERIFEKELSTIMDLKIKSISILRIPLFNSFFNHTLQDMLDCFKLLIHPAIFSLTLSHYAIQLNMENDKDIIIAEYGQYLAKDSNNIDVKYNYNFNNSSSTNIKREQENDNHYYYINKDGVRLTKVDFDYYYKNLGNYQYSHYIKNIRWTDVPEEIKSILILYIIASNHYKIPLNKFLEGLDSGEFSMAQRVFQCINCEINNKITLREFCSNFIGEKWEARNYTLYKNNCQKFAAEVIKILKATRIKETDKIRTFEKKSLPNCMIKELWKNEKLSLTNSLGRIPIFGFFYDVYKIIKLKDEW